MSLQEFIKGASDVCYRPPKFRFSVRAAENILSKIEYTRMLQYLGEIEDQTSATSSVPALEVILNKMPTRFKDLHDVLGRIIGTYQESQTTEITQFYRCSIDIYRFLYTIFGSIKRVKATRTLYKVLDDCTKISPVYTNISSGGQGEGLNIPNGDYDLMTVLEQIKVKLDCSVIEEDQPILLFDNQYSYPGFAHLKIGQNRFSKELFTSWGEYTIYGPLISNHRFKNYFMSRYQDHDCKIHGPCISDLPETVDHLFCFRAMLWPDVAESWLTRNKSSIWPPTDVMLNSVSHGILIVPIGSKFGSSEDCSFEWRISFSLQERDLIHSFNYVQLLCLTVLKYFKKDVLKETFLCSYFIKTTLFWLCEELNENMWNPENFVQCIHELQRRLLYWVRYGYCPHYFIAENNLFEGVLTEEMKIILETLLHNIAPLFFQSIHYGNMCSNFKFTHFDHFKELNTPFIEKSKSIFILLKIIRRSLSMCNLTQSSGILYKTLFRLLHNKFSYFTKGVYLLLFCYANQVFTQRLQTEVCKENKKMYLINRQCIAHSLIGTNVDAVAGWLLLASYFYEKGKPLCVLKIIDVILTKSIDDKMLIADGYHEDVMMTYLEQVASTNWNYKLSVLNYMKMHCVDMIYVIPGSP
ncbi:unnamed protein product [Mytilus edulis]|uniref:Mab-21-like HhH/H2TH-like domain-containing protein n=1 Tax=Mytilus edulis TaxID=6550 RepID=A0A8S3S6L6_MYTED|nr:unnamed protein product [Mytilus edulis]